MLVVLVVVFYSKLDMKNVALEAEIQYLKQVVSRIEKVGIREDIETNVSILKSSLDRLGSRNILTQYQAGLTIQSLGDPAVPELIKLLSSRNKRAGKAALILLQKSRYTDYHGLLKEQVVQVLDNPDFRSKYKGAVLQLLAKCHKKEDGPFFMQCYDTGLEEDVKLCAVYGFRKVGYVTAFPRLLTDWGQSTELLNKQLLKTLLDMSANYPEQVKVIMKGSSDFDKFKFTKLAKGNSEVGVESVMDFLSKDQNPKVVQSAIESLKTNQAKKQVKEVKGLLEGDALKELKNILK